jgi:hypothetical protein
VATHHAISSVGQSIVGLLKAARIQSEFPNADFRLFQAGDFENGLNEGVSVYLYRVIVSQGRRRLTARTTPQGKTLRPPLPLDLYYMITPWGRTPEMQHLLLGWAMRTLEDTTTLPSGLLNTYSPNTFFDDEAVDLVHETMSVPDLTSVWNNIGETGKSIVQVSVTYVARVVAIDSTVEAAQTSGLVQTRHFNAGRKVA